MATFDFTELDKKPPGEALEALVRLIGARLGMRVEWSGRGADGGRDLIFHETQEGPLKSRSIKWLVNCKDNSDSGASVGERDIGSVTDKIAQHKCSGFLLATTTTASTGLKDKLDRLDFSSGGDIHTKVWDRFELTKFLLEDRFSDLMLQFFPRQKARAVALTIDHAREIIESSVPRVVIGAIRRHLVPHEERVALLSGEKIWPHDKDQQNLINTLNIDLIRRRFIFLKSAAQIAQHLQFEAFLAFVDALIRNFPTEARQLLVMVTKITPENSLAFNAVQILREYEDFSQDEEIEITKRCDRETLFELYHESTYEFLSDARIWADRLPTEAHRSFDQAVLQYIKRLDDLEFSGGGFC
jgi:Restriction endonuclease